MPIIASVPKLQGNHICPVCKTGLVGNEFTSLIRFPTRFSLEKVDPGPHVHIASVNRKTAVGEDVMTIEWAIRPGWVEPSPADGVTLHVTDRYTNASMRYRLEFPTASHRHVSLVGSGSHLGRYKIQDASHPVFNLVTANACIHAPAVIRRVQIGNGDFQLVDMLADVNESETSLIGVTPSSPLGFKIVEYGERVGTPGFRNATITVTLGVDDAVFEERLTVTWIRYQ